MIIKVEGNIRLFIKKCIKNDIDMKNIKYYKDYITLIIDPNDFEKVVRLNYYCNVTLVKYLGNMGRIIFIKRYSYDFLMLIIFLICTFLISNINVRVDILNESTTLREQVKDIIEEYNIRPYQISKKINYLNKVSDDILKNNRNFLEWISINKEGMHYIVNFEERIDTNKEEIKGECNIIATKNGTIKKLVVSHGEALVDTGIVVKKGDVLISGILIHNEKIKDVLCASGDVFAEVWYKVHITVPYNYQEKVYTKKNRINLFFNGNYLYKRNYEHFSQKNLFETKVFGNIFRIIKESEYQIKEKKYTLDEAINIGIDTAKERLLEKTGKNSEIIDQKVLKETKNNSKIELDVFISVYENIAKSVKIERSDLGDTDESNLHSD